MPRYLLAREVAERISEELNVPLNDVVDVLVKIPAAGVIPISECLEMQERKIKQIYDSAICSALRYISDARPAEVVERILSDIKKQIHDKAVYPNCHGVEPYISLKVFDAVINKLIGS